MENFKDLGKATAVLNDPTALTLGYVSSGGCYGCGSAVAKLQSFEDGPLEVYLGYFQPCILTLFFYRHGQKILLLFKGWN